MTDTTDRWQLGLLYASQAQKETTHNEALTRIDLLLNPVVEAIGTNVPPPSPDPGQAWIVGSAPQAAWTGAEGMLAGWTPGGWRFVAPQYGMCVWSRADGLYATFLEGQWRIGEVAATMLQIGGVQVVGPRLAAVADPVGGAVVDAEARSAIADILTRLRGHGLLENG